MMKRRLESAAVLLAASLMLPGYAEAQLKGHYIPGFTGVQNGSQGPPALTVVMPVFFYTTDKLKDDDGNTIGAVDRINSSFLGPGLLWVTNAKVLGAHLGGQVVPAAFIKTRIETTSLDVGGQLDFTDIYFQPIQLGWERTRADFVAGWGVFAPTGEWEFRGPDNSGLGMWSNLFQGGTTVRLDDERQWTLSTLASYEIHSEKKDTEIKVGDILTFEGGLARSFYKEVGGTKIPRITTIGLAYYGQFKVTGDSASIFTSLLQQRKDRVFGVGVEGSVFLPAPKLLVDFRFVPEWGAMNRTQGLTFMLTVAHQLKSLAKAP
jgi:hypothetical protein